MTYSSNVDYNKVESYVCGICMKGWGIETIMESACVIPDCTSGILLLG